MKDFHNSQPEQLRWIYQRTDIKRAPMTGIVSGYHTLPFTLIGPNDENEPTEKGGQGSLKLTGKISVTPKLVMPVTPHDEQFSDIFPEMEPFMDPGMVSRVFSFSLAYRKNIRIRNEHLAVESFPNPDNELLDKVLDELNRSEIVNMGVIWCPAPRFYPVSLERFIFSVIDREFK
ncbi:MAG TPA: hypothetical protein DCQ83_05060 [Fibrobacteres bacterium]|jgi:hypothetical protein|nr:hypothetical protein [Fibrobacterota bacterium]